MVPLNSHLIIFNLHQGSRLLVLHSVLAKHSRSFRYLVWSRRAFRYHRGTQKIFKYGLHCQAAVGPHLTDKTSTDVNPRQCIDAVRTLQWEPLKLRGGNGWCGRHASLMEAELGRSLEIWVRCKQGIILYKWPKLPFHQRCTQGLIYMYADLLPLGTRHHLDLFPSGYKADERD